MQALQFAVDYPELVRGVVAIASTAHLDTQGVALNSVARNAITSDPDWQGGDYYGTGRAPRAGLALARQIGHITYLSRTRSARSSGRRPFRRRELPRVPGREVRQALRREHLPALVAWRSRASTSPHGAHAGRTRAGSCSSRFTSDWIYPPSDSDGLAAALERGGKDVEHVDVGDDLRSRLVPARGRSCRRRTYGGFSSAPTRRHDERRAGVGLRHAPGARRPAPRPVHRRPRGADLPDGELRLRGRRVRGRVLQPAGVRQHLLADHEPDHRGVRGARRDRSRVGSARSRSRAGSRPRRRHCSRCSSPATTSSRRRRCTAGRSRS